MLAVVGCRFLSSLQISDFSLISHCHPSPVTSVKQYFQYHIMFNVVSSDGRNRTKFVVIFVPRRARAKPTQTHHMVFSNDFSVGSSR
jgi:hypothetical protein